MYLGFAGMYDWIGIDEVQAHVAADQAQQLVVEAEVLGLGAVISIIQVDIAANGSK